MDQDLLGGSPVSSDSTVIEGDPEIEICITGDGFSLGRIKLPINPYGGTHYRTQELGNSPIDEWVLDADAFKGIGSCSVRTHDSEGHRAMIFEIENLKHGDIIDQDVVLEMDGKKISLHIELKYNIRPYFQF